MKTITLWQILYLNDDCLREFYLTKQHYDRLINYFNLPIKVYGVLYGTDSEPTMKNDVLYLPLYDRDMKEADASTYLKFADFLVSDIEPSDYHVRITPSTFVNLLRVNSFIQNNDFSQTVLCGEMQESYVGYRHCIYPRGNFVMYTDEMRKQMKEILCNKSLSELIREGCGTNDDHLLGTLLFNELNMKYKALGLHSTTDKTERLTPDNIDDAYLIVYKDYNNEKQGYALYFLEWLVGYFEKKYNITHTPTDTQFNGSWRVSPELFEQWLKNVNI